MRQLLRNIAEIGAGQGAPQGDSNYCEDGIPFVKAGNLQGLTTGDKITDIQKVSDEVAKAHKLKLYPKGTILFAKSGMSCLKGYVYVLPVDAYVVNHLACITPQEDISEYLRYYFTFHRPNQLVKDASYPSISLADIGSLEIDIKDSNTRTHIISVLGALENVIEIRKKELQSFDTLIKARFVEMFGDFKINNKGWPIKPFKRIAKIDTYMIHDFSNYQDYPHVGIDNIEKNTGRIHGFKSIKEDGVISGKYLFTPEHIIYSKIRPNLNKVAMPDFTGLCSADAYPILVNKEECNREFLTYTMRGQAFLDYIISFSNRTNLPKVNKEQVEGFHCPVPPLLLQDQFATFVSYITQTKSTIQQSLDTTQLLLDSLMQRYFG